MKFEHSINFHHCKNNKPHKIWLKNPLTLRKFWIKVFCAYLKKCLPYFPIYSFLRNFTRLVYCTLCIVCIVNIVYWTLCALCICPLTICIVNYATNFLGAYWPPNNSEGWVGWIVKSIVIFRNWYWHISRRKEEEKKKKKCLHFKMVQLLLSQMRGWGKIRRNQRRK